MATRGTIPAKKGGAKPRAAAKNVKRKAAAPARAGREVPVTAPPLSPQQVVDRLVELAIQHARGSAQQSFIIPIASARGEFGLYLAFGSPAGICAQIERVSPAPKRRLVRDSVTGLFLRAREALRRPKSTNTETR